MDLKRNIPFTPDADDVLKTVLESWPLIIRHLWEGRIREISNLVALSRGEGKISKEILMEALNTWPFANNKFRIMGTLAAKGKMSGDFKNKSQSDVKLPDTGNWSISKPVEKLKKKIGDIKVLGILSSPRENGNTDLLLSEILRGAKDKGANVEKASIGRMKIEFCNGCGACKQEKKLPGFCVIKDDLTNGLYQKFLDADIYVIGFPIYTGRENAALSNFFDRFYGVGIGRFPWEWKDEDKKRGALVATWGSPSFFFEKAVENYCDLLGWYGIDVREAIYARGCQKKGEIAKDKKGLDTAYQAGQRLVS